MLLVFGSLNVDLVFVVEHLPAPGETVLTSGYERLPGGKGANQAAAAARAGAAVRMAGAVGVDPLADVATGGLASAGVDLALLRQLPVPTGVAVIGVDRAGENAIIVAAGANAKASAAAVPDAALETATTLLLQNEVPLAESLALARRARRHGIRVIWNLAPAAALAPEALAAVDVLVVNRGELAGVGGAGEPRVVACRLREAHDVDLVVTLGRDGALVVDPTGATAVPRLEVDVVDTTGAGDAFVGALAAALDAGVPLVEAARRAAVAGAIACTRVGAQAAQPDRPAIDAALQRLGPSSRCE